MNCGSLVMFPVPPGAGTVQLESKREPLWFASPNTAVLP